MGLRGVGTNGRSLLNVLEDARTYLQGLRDAGLLPSSRGRCSPSTESASTACDSASSDDFVSEALESGWTSREVPMLDAFAPLHRQALMQSRSIFAIELENAWIWTVTRASQGALEFFRDAPFGSIIGQSLAHLIRCDELPVDLHMMHRMWSSSCGTVGIHDGCQERLQVIDFSASVQHIDEIFSRDPLDWQHSTEAAYKFDGLDAIVPSRYVPIVAHFLPPQNREASAGQDHDSRRLLIVTFEDPTVMFFNPNPPEGGVTLEGDEEEEKEQGKTKKEKEEGKEKEEEQEKETEMYA